MRIAAPSTVFGISRALTEEECFNLSSFLSEVWRTQRGHPPMKIESDLAFLESFFRPTLTGRKLRDIVARLPRLSSSPPLNLTEQVFLESPTGQGLVTPEGRVLLDLLPQPPTRTAVAISTDELAWAYSTVATFYRNVSRDRVLEALGIRTGALRLPVIGFSLFLLVNGSVGERNAFRIPSNPKKEEDLSRLLGPIIEEFVNALATKSKRAEPFRLRGGWVLSETRRHLFHYVDSARDSIWIRHRTVQSLTKKLGNELAVRDKNRRRHDVENAFEALLLAYSKARPGLASRASTHERSSQTRAIRDLLLESFNLAKEEIF